jgi:hypothetical protein
MPNHRPRNTGTQRRVPDRADLPDHEAQPVVADIAHITYGGVAAGS